jgi:alpha-methylacyl-CoA racemase
VNAEDRGPLAGVRVVEIAGIGPAPFAAMILAELGASVVRVERPGGVSPMAAADGLQRSRPNVAVDLKHPDGVAVVRRLAVDADVLIEGMRPGAMERLGLGPDGLLTDNPRLVYGRMTGWGQDGPLAQVAGHDITYAAITGALHACGPADRPMPPLNILADFAGGSLPLVVGILAALHSRERTGEGQVVDAAMVDGAVGLLSMVHGLLAAGLWQDRRGVNLLDGGVPFYDTYECADGRWVAVGALEPQFWAELNRILGLSFDRPQEDQAGWAAQRAAYAAAFRSRTRDQWAAAFDGTDACVAPVLSLEEAAEPPHLAARRAFAELPEGRVPRVAPRFSGTPAPEPTPRQAVGEGTVEVLLGRGFTRAEVDALLASGAVVQA